MVEEGHRSIGPASELVTEPGAGPAGGLPPDHESNSPFQRYFGLEFGQSDSGVGTVSLALQPHHLQGAGVVHGGVVATLADTACFWAVHSLLGPGEQTTTIEIKLNFLASARSGTLHANAKALDYSNRLAVVEIEITDDSGRAIAQGLSTYLVLD